MLAEGFETALKGFETSVAASCRHQAEDFTLFATPPPAPHTFVEWKRVLLALTWAAAAAPAVIFLADRNTMQFKELAVWVFTAKTKVTGNQTWALFKHYYCSVSPDKIPPGFFRYWQGPADMVWAAASSCVSPCSNLHLLPSWELSDIVCIHLQTRMLFSVDWVFLKRAGRRDVISAALRACLDPHTPTPCSALGNDTYSPSIYFLLVVLSLWLN